MATSLRKKLRLFWLMSRLRVMDRLDSKVSFLIMESGALLKVLFNVAFFGIVFQYVPQIAGWGFAEAQILVGITELVDCLATMSWRRSYWRLPDMLINGELDGYIIRPIDTRFYLTFFNSDIFFGWLNLLLNVGIIASGLMQTKYPVNLPIFLLCILGVILFHFSFLRAMAALQFFVDIPHPNFMMDEIMNLGKYPRDVYRGLFKILFSTIIPVLVIYNLPVLFLIGQATTFDYFWFIGLLAVFFFGSGYFFNLGLKRYESAKG